MEINAGDTAWVMASAALVMLMTPGLALFYGGMVRAKSVLNMIMMSFLALGIVTIIWLTYGYSLAFGKDAGGGLIGGLEFAGLRNTVDAVTGGEGKVIPLLAFVMFQMTFAIITCALLSGAVADRIRTRAWVVLVIAWTTLVYIPIAHWAFAFQDGSGGWIGDRLGALDFAGGTAVEINSGFSSLALAIVVGARIGFRREPMRPHNLPLVLLGAGLLWFGWFGFNAGSALSAGHLAATAMINTQIATAAASLTWVVAERLRDGKATTLGIASGAISGAVAITPSCGFVTPMGALAIGLAAGAICALAVGIKYRLGYDDSLDVLGVHGVGGLVGMIGIGLLATTAVNGAGADGLLAGGGLDLLGKQSLAAVATMAYAFTATWVIAKVVDRVVGFRVAPDAEIAGIDLSEHAESAYEFTDASAGSGAFAGIGSASLSQYLKHGSDRDRSGQE